MADPFIGEIRIFASSFAPRTWAFCNGQTLPISQNTALFAVLGTTYGGDGRTTVGLPNLPGRVPMHAGQGPGLSRRTLGQTSGNSTTTITTANLPAHSHSLQVSDQEGDVEEPATNTAIGIPDGADLFGPSNDLVALNGQAVGSVGTGQSMNNLQPYLGINFIIALNGTFPNRS